MCLIKGIGIIGFTSASGPPLLVYKYTKTFQHNFPEIGIWTPIDTNKGRRTFSPFF